MQPVLALAAADESGVFIMSMICWQLGDIPAEAPPPAVIGLIFAIAFVRLLSKPA